MSDAPTGPEVVAAWNQLAPFWDERSGPHGSEIHRLLISPSVHRLLDVQPGEHVLDVGCGNGVVAREMARLGATNAQYQFRERADTARSGACHASPPDRLVVQVRGA